MTMNHLSTSLMPGDFIRVNSSCADRTRAGKDALVLALDGDQVVLVFGWDRFSRDQKVICVGPEQWDRSELDLASVDRATVLSEGREQFFRENNVMSFH